MLPTPSLLPSIAERERSRQYRGNMIRAPSANAASTIRPNPNIQAVRAENLCHQVIFVDYAAGAVAPADTEVVQFGGATRQWAERRSLAQGAMWPVRVVEVLVLAQDRHQVALVPDQGPVQQLTAATADPAFHDRVHSGRLDSGADHPGASGLEGGVERGSETGVPGMQDKPRSSPRLPGPSAGSGPAALPRTGPALRGAQPSPGRPARSRADPGVLEGLPDRGRRHRDAARGGPRRGCGGIPTTRSPGPAAARPTVPCDALPGSRRPWRDNRAQRRRTMSRCQRMMVPAVTISPIPASRSTGSVPASRASHARSGHVSSARTRGRRRRAQRADRRHEYPGVLPHDSAATTPAPTWHGTRPGRSASSPQAEDHPTSGRTKTGPAADAERLPATGQGPLAYAQVAQAFGTHRVSGGDQLADELRLCTYRLVCTYRSVC